MVIAARDAATTLGQQLEALTRELADLERPWEVVVADNGSTDATREVAESFRDALPGVRVIDASAELGAGPARNAGAASTDAEQLLFVDADDVVLPGWARAWAAALDDGFDLAAGATLNWDGGPLPRSRCPAQPYRLLGFWPYASSSNMAVRHAVFDQAGGFDQRFVRAQDVELSWRLQRAGARYRFVPDAAIAFRVAHGAGAVFRRAHHTGYFDPFLFREFRDAGLRRPPWPATVRSYGGLVARLPLLVDADVRDRWLRQLGRRTGRVRGSVAARTVVL